MVVGWLVVINCRYFFALDIRDSVNYKEVMKKYNLGPNGGIVTSLNLFATRIDQVMGLLEKRAPEVTYDYRMGGRGVNVGNV